MRKKLDGTAETLLRALGVAVEICVLSVVPAAGVVLDRLQLTVGLCLDMLVQDVVLWKIPQDALLPSIYRKSAHACGGCASRFPHLHIACRQSRAAACHPTSCANPGAWGRLFRLGGKSRAGPGRWATCSAVLQSVHS